MQVLQATVLFSAGKSFASKLSKGRGGLPERSSYRQSIKLQLPNGEEVSIWFDAGHADYCSLVRGEVVTVIQDKDKYTVVFPDVEEETPEEAIARVQAAQVAQSISAIANSNGSAPQVTPAIGASKLDPQLKAEIFSELCTRAKIFRTCHLQIQQLFTNENGEVIIGEETLQKYAITLYVDLKEFWS